MQLFFSNVKVAFEQLMMLYLIVGVGLAAERLGWFSEKTARRCTELLLYIITPCVIIKSFLNMEYSPAVLRNLLIALGGGVLLHGLGIVLTIPFFRGKRAPDTDPILHYAAVYGNCGYMALPLVQAMVGSEGVFYCSIVIMTFQIFSFTHGEYAMMGGFIGQHKSERDRERVRFRWRKLLLNAGVLSVAVGLPLFLLKIPVPDVIKTPIESIAAMNSPLAMLMFGAYLSRTKLRGVLRNRKLFLSMGIKLFVLPAAVMAFLLMCGVRGPLLNALMIPASAPCANNTAIFAAKHHRDTGYAAQVVSLMSLVSILTMPLMIAAALSF